MKQNGFTLVELITVLILLGILSAVTLPRFFFSYTFSDAFDRNDFESALVWARNRAATSQCAHEVRITGSGWSVLKDTTCGSTASEGACPSGVVYDFANAIAETNSQPLSSTNLVSSGVNMRFIFTEDGQVFEPNNLPTLSACTILNTAPISPDTRYTLSAGTLTIDGATAYVDVK